MRTISAERRTEEHEKYSIYNSIKKPVESASAV
jgi:hypothetical protein